MKYSIDFTNRFKKSLRKGVKRGLDPILIEKAVEKLANEGKLPPSHKSHKTSWKPGGHLGMPHNSRLVDAMGIKR